MHGKTSGVGGVKTRKMAKTLPMQQKHLEANRRFSAIWDITVPSSLHDCGKKRWETHMYLRKSQIALSRCTGTGLNESLSLSKTSQRRQMAINSSIMHSGSVRAVTEGNVLSADL